LNEPTGVRAPETITTSVISMFLQSGFAALRAKWREWGLG
jgi:hypothetical protein